MEGQFLPALSECPGIAFSNTGFNSPSISDILMRANGFRVRESFPESLESSNMKNKMQIFNIGKLPSRTERSKGHKSEQNS